MSRKNLPSAARKLMKYLDEHDDDLNEIDSQDNLLSQELAQFSGDTHFYKVLEHLMKIADKNRQQGKKREVKPDRVDATKKTNPPKNYFTNNLEHINSLEQEAILLLACGYIRAKQISTFSENNFLTKFTLPAKITTLLELEEFIALIQLERKQMEQESANNGVSLKFVELCNNYKLDDFTQKILLIIFTHSNSFKFHYLFQKSDIALWSGKRQDLTIGTILMILCQNFIDQLDRRKYFSINHPLVKHEIIELSLYNNINILQADVELHSRFCRFIMDDQNTYDTDFNCISSEVGSVNIDQIIIDEKTKRDVVSYTKSFINNIKNRDQLSQLYGYGVGLTFLFHGPSGTGKTMMAHALANHFGKKLYSINVQGLENESISFEDALKFAFREARINNGIVFLDECDDIFQEKSYQSRTFLIEVEKACCMTILASNTALKLDPAMDRRINMKTFFPMPNKKMRARIWQALTPSTLNLDEGDFQELAEKYIFTGGLIKNALVMASTSLSSDNESNAIIEKSAVIAEIHTAAQYQADSIFDHNGYGTVITPHIKLDELIINPNDKEKLLSLIRHYPAILDNGHCFCGLISTTDR